MIVKGKMGAGGGWECERWVGLLTCVVNDRVEKVLCW